MKLFTTIILSIVFGFYSPTDITSTLVTDNYQIKKTKNTSTGKTYEIKCTECGKYITVYYKSNSKKYARGDSPWYTQYSSLDKAATNGCDDKCD